MNQNSPFDSFDQLQISTQAKSFLREIAKWANFLSILGFIFVGFIFLFIIIMLVFGASTTIFSNSFQGGIMGMGIAVIYIIVGLFYFFPIYFLNRFAVFLKNALNSNDNEKLTEAFKYLKSHYKFIGIFTLVILSIYVLIFLFGILGAGMSALN